MNKICARCEQQKELSLFSKKKDSPDGHQYWCKSCVSKNTSSYYKNKNLDPVFRKQQSVKSAKIKKKYPEVYKNSELLRKYGLTIEQYKQMLLTQDYRCGICKSQLTRPNVDHCHITGKVRKLLCKNCNTLLGQAKDSISILKNAISYLKEFKNETNS